MVLARIARPQSKRAMVARLAQEGALTLNLDMVYRSMDALTDARAEAICALSQEQARTLLPDPITVVFYDTTTLYFESEQEIGLRVKGYSKDGKPHRVQVVLALLITPEGLPIGYELFPGNLDEGHTLVTALAVLERGTPYILGARLKASPKALKAPILEVAAYDAWGRTAYADSVAAIRDLSLDDGSRLVVTHSPRRARKDAQDRRWRIEKLRKKLEKGATPAALSTAGAARFLDFPDGHVAINEDKIAKAAAWDGLRGIVAWGCDAADPRDLIGQYRCLAEIEACFCTNKHDLRIRPVFHWKDRRIRAHIALQISLLYETNGPRTFALPSRAT